MRKTGVAYGALCSAGNQIPHRAKENRAASQIRSRGQQGPKQGGNRNCFGQGDWTIGISSTRTKNQPAEAHAGQVKSAQRKTEIGADHHAGTEQGKTVVAAQKPDQKNQAAASQITGGKASA
jgi:hypothetical protein